MTLWNPTYSVGHELLDAQHRILLRLCDEVGQLDPASGSRIMPIQEVFNQLRLYAQVHFTTEEELLAETDYPELDEQRIEHDKYWETLGKMLEAVAEGNADCNGVRDFLIGWWQRHILVSDMRYKEHLGKALAAESTPAQTGLGETPAGRSGKPIASANPAAGPMTRENVARSELQLEQLATLYPKCRACGAEGVTTRCDAQRCPIAGNCDFAIREFLQIGKTLSKRHFEDEHRVMQWIGNRGHERIHRQAHDRLIAKLSFIGQTYEPLGDRLKTIQDIVDWGEDVLAHKRSEDVEFWRLWSLRESMTA